MANRFAPPADLLQQIEGIEQGLQKGKRLGRAGGLGAVLAGAAETAVVVTQAATSIDLTKVGYLAFLAPAFVFVASLGVRNWTRFWLKESRQPFRFTYGVEGFTAAPASIRVEPKLDWLRQDLMEQFSWRIGRLSRLDDDPSGDGSATGVGGAGSGGEPTGSPGGGSHFHVSGSYVIREVPNEDRLRLEITAWIRKGPAGQPGKLAHPIRFNLDLADAEPPIRSSGALQPAHQADGEQPGPTVAGLSTDAYRRVLERVFFSVASEIYAQIRSDVQRKIDLLPNDRFRAVAYLHEAEDFARSNTLDSYDAARELYAQAIRLHDPSWDRLSSRRWLRNLQRARRWVAQRMAGVRILLSRVFPRLGRPQVLLARAEIGYANMLLYRRALAALSGQRVNAVFEARPVAMRAVDRLLDLRENVPQRREALCQAYVTSALMWTHLRSRRRADASLAGARDLNPAIVDQDARYLFAAGMSETRTLAKLPLLRRAAELDPEFEVANFHLALTSERLWRSRPTFEPSVARDFVQRYYERVVALNPGNVAAWGNLGYVAWLVGDLRRAKNAFESGLEYKDIRQDTFVAELEYGLARVAVEEKSLESAFTHYRLGVIEEVAQGNSFRPRGYTGYLFDSMSWPILDRFVRFRARSAVALDSAPPTSLPARVKDAVRAFVLNDYAEACWNGFLATSDRRLLNIAHRAYERARTLNPEYVLPPYRLYWVLREIERYLFLAPAEDALAPVNALQEIGPITDKQLQYLETVNEVEPGWLDGNIALALERVIRHSADRDIFQTLLPHEWLWVYDPSEGLQLDWKVFKRRRLDRDHTWERELDDVHVMTLFTLGRGLADRPPAGPTKRTKLFRLPRGPGKHVDDAERAAIIFRHIQRHYFPDDAELLRLMHPPSPPDKLRWGTRIWLSDDSITFRALRGGAARILRAAVQSGWENASTDLEQLVRDVWTFPDRAKLVLRSLPILDRKRGMSEAQALFLEGLVPMVCRREAMRLAVWGWLASSPTPYWALKALLEPGKDGTPIFSLAEQADALAEASREPNSSRVLRSWQGDQLRQLGDRLDSDNQRVAAGNAYGAAIPAIQSRTVLTEMAVRLDSRGYERQAEEARQAAARRT